MIFSKNNRKKTMARCNRSKVRLADLHLGVVVILFRTSNSIMRSRVPALVSPIHVKVAEASQVTV